MSFLKKSVDGFETPPVVGRRQDVAGQVQLSQELAGSDGLVAGDAHEVAGVLECLHAGPRVWVEIGCVEVLA